MNRYEAIDEVKTYMRLYDETSFEKIGSGEYWDSGNYDDAFDYGKNVGRIRTLIQIFALQEEEIA